jgi:predicted small secreted protein
MKMLTILFLALTLLTACATTQGRSHFSQGSG